MASHAVSPPSLTRYRQETDPHRAFLTQNPASSRDRAGEMAKGLKEWDRKWAMMDNNNNTKQREADKTREMSRHGLL